MAVCRMLVVVPCLLFVACCWLFILACCSPFVNCRLLLGCYVVYWCLSMVCLFFLA